MTHPNSLQDLFASAEIEATPATTGAPTGATGTTTEENGDRLAEETVCITLTFQPASTFETRAILGTVGIKGHLPVFINGNGDNTLTLADLPALITAHYATLQTTLPNPLQAPEPSPAPAKLPPPKAEPAPADDLF